MKRIDARAALRQGVAWIDGYHVGPYDSAASILQKLRILNQGSMKRVITAALGTNLQHKSQQFWHGRESLLLGPPDGAIERKGAFGEAILDGCLDTYGLPRGSSRFSFDRLQYCRACLARAYHPIFFNLDVVDTCPIHKIKTISQCPSCAHGKLSAITTEIGRTGPYQCDYCDWCAITSFGRGTEGEAREFFSSALKAWAPFAKWLLRTRKINCGFLNVESHLWFRQAMDPGRAPKRLMTPLPAHCLLRSWPGAKLSEKEVALIRASSMKEDRQRIFDKLAPIYKSIRRHLWREIRRKHPYCADYIERRNGRGMLSNEGFTDECFLGRAYFRWRRQMEIYPRLMRSQAALELSSQKIDMYSWHDASAAVWANSTLGLFFDILRNLALQSPDSLGPTDSGMPALLVQPRAGFLNDHFYSSATGRFWILRENNKLFQAFSGRLGPHCCRRHEHYDGPPESPEIQARLKIVKAINEILHEGLRSSKGPRSEVGTFRFLEPDGDL